MAKIKLTVIKNLDGLERVLKNFSKVNTVLFKAGTLSKLELTKNWLSGRGGNRLPWKGEFLENPASELSPGYKIYKAKRGKVPIPNMSFSGDMQRALTPNKKGKDGVILNFIGEEVKSSAMQNQRPNFFKLSKKFKNKMVEMVRKFIFPF